MDWVQIALLVGSGFLAGVINSVAGGGTFFTFPALIFAGVSPIAANATSTIAVWPGALASAFAYRKQLHIERRELYALAFTSFVGGGLGAAILLLTPVQTFEALIPWLMLGATLLFAFGHKLRRELAKAQNANFTSSKSIILQFAIAIYGGYFGAGIGILMLALLTLLGLNDIHKMNALKAILGSAINGIAVIIFVLSGVVNWPAASIMVLAAIFGGYFGAHYAQKISKESVKRGVVLTGLLMSIWFFIK